MENSVIEIIKSITGLNEDGFPKATVGLQHQVDFGVAEHGAAGLKVLDQAQTVYAEAGLGVSNKKTTIALTFNSFDDVDYIRFRGLLEGWENRDIDFPRYLILSMCDTETNENFIVGPVECHYFDGDAARIRFVADAEQVRVFRSENEEDADEELE